MVGGWRKVVGKWAWAWVVAAAIAGCALLLSFDELASGPLVEAMYYRSTGTPLDGVIDRGSHLPLEYYQGRMTDLVHQAVFGLLVLATAAVCGEVAATSPGTTRKTRWMWTSVAAITLMAAALRFLDLGEESFWGDELITWRISTSGPLPRLVQYVAERSTHPPGYFALIAGANAIFGTTEGAMRMPSAAAGLLSVPAIFLLGRELYSAREGVVAASLMAVASTAIYYSQEARANALMMLLSIVTFGLWIVLVGGIVRRRAPSAWIVLSYLLSVVVLEYLHYYGTLVVALQALGLLLVSVVRRSGLKWVVIVCSLSALAILPWAPSALGQLAANSEYWVERPTPDSVWGFMRFAFGDSSVMAWIALTILSGAAASGLFAWMQRRDQAGGVRTGLLGWQTAFVLLWFVLPLTIVFLLSWTVVPVFLERSLLVSVPAGFLLLARALRRLSSTTPRLAWATVLLCGAWLFRLVFSMDYYRAPQKQQLREAIAFIADREAEFQPAIGATWAQCEDLSQFDYYFDRFNSNLGISLLMGRADQTADFDAAVRQSGAHYIWYLETYRAPEEGFIDHLTGRYQTVAFQAFIGTKVVVLDATRPPQAEETG